MPRKRIRPITVGAWLAIFSLLFAAMASVAALPLHAQSGKHKAKASEIQSRLHFFRMATSLTQSAPPRSKRLRRADRENYRLGDDDLAGEWYSHGSGKVADAAAGEQANRLADSQSPQSLDTSFSIANIRTQIHSNESSNGALFSNHLQYDTAKREYSEANSNVDVWTSPQSDADGNVKFENVDENNQAAYTQIAVKPYLSERSRKPSILSLRNQLSVATAHQPHFAECMTINNKRGIACPKPQSTQLHHDVVYCIEEEQLCNNEIDCPGAEDEDKVGCLFYYVTQKALTRTMNFLTDITEFIQQHHHSYNDRRHRRRHHGRRRQHKLAPDDNADLDDEL